MSSRSKSEKSEKAGKSDIVNINKLQENLSEKSDKSSSLKNKPAVVDSDDISTDQLALASNKKKLSKRPTDVDVDVSIQEQSDKSSEKKRSKRKSKDSSDKSKSSKSSKSTKVESDSYKKKRIQKENKNEYIRKEKSELLYKFNKIHMREKWSSLSFDMNNSLEEIQNEYDRVINAIKVDRNVKYLKRMLLLGVQGVEMLNNRFDPFGIDLDGWSESMSYNMDLQDYDEVMAELYEKYKSVGNMSPEMKLIFMIISSAAFFTISKKITKLDTQGGFMNFLGNLMPKQSSTPASASQHQSPPPPPQQPLFNPPLQQNNNYTADTTEDNTPSKLQDPQKLQDTITLNNIMEKMKKQEEKKTQEINDSAIETDHVKSIPSMTMKKRGRPIKKR